MRSKPKIKRITGDMTMVALRPTSELPYLTGTMQHKKALMAMGAAEAEKKVGQAKRLHTGALYVTSHTIHELVREGFIGVKESVSSKTKAVARRALLNIDVKRGKTKPKHRDGTIRSELVALYEKHGYVEGRAKAIKQGYNEFTVKKQMRLIHADKTKKSTKTIQLQVSVFWDEAKNQIHLVCPEFDFHVWVSNRETGSDRPRAHPMLFEHLAKALAQRGKPHPKILRA